MVSDYFGRKTHEGILDDLNIIGYNPQMSEQLRQPEEITPEYLHREVQMIYRSLPDRVRRSFSSGDSNANTESLITELLGRMNSQHKDILISHLKRVLSYSRTTASFQEIVGLLYENVYFVGKTSPNGRFTSANELVLLSALDLEHESSAGIFNPEKAKETEKNLYNEFEIRLINYTATNLTVYDFSGSEDSNNLEDTLFLREKLHIWRNEFQAIHGEMIVER